MTLQWYISNFDDPNLIPENIKKNVTILGKLWTFEWAGAGGFWVLITVPVAGYQNPLKYYKIWNMIILASADFGYEGGYYNDATTRAYICWLAGFTTVVEYISCTKETPSGSALYLTQRRNDWSRHFSLQFWKDVLLAMICS